MVGNRSAAAVTVRSPLRCSEIRKATKDCQALGGPCSQHRDILLYLLILKCAEAAFEQSRFLPCSGFSALAWLVEAARPLSRHWAR